MGTYQPASKTETNFELRDCFLAPWGLSSEELPMHVLWSGDFGKVEIDIPNELTLSEIHNCELGDDRKGNEEPITIGNDELITDGYFGMILTDENKYDDPVKKHTIEICFYSDNDEQTTIEKVTRIIRPEIRVQDAPDKIHLSDQNIPDTIEIDMEYVGWGMAQVAVEAEAEGELISEGDSLQHDLLEALLETEFHKQDLDGVGDIPDEWKNESDVEVPQEEIEDIVQDMSELARSDELSGEYESQELMEMADILEEAHESSESASDISAVIYRFIETALLSSILDVVDRHPTENVSLDNPTTKIRTKARATELEVVIRLRDSLENEYEPESIDIEIVDERDSEAGVFESEIITNWDNYQVDPDEVFSDE